MKWSSSKRITITVLCLIFLFSVANGAELTLNNTPAQVCFSPNGGCTETIVNQIEASKSEILVQAYSFTSAPIAKTLVNAHKRGVKIEARSQKDIPPPLLYLTLESQHTLTANTPLRIIRS
jgi:phosphatidylserine/phosphatidylglycerophosphate/cardiolipin synthase-like enzyme